MRKIVLAAALAAAVGAATGLQLESASAQSTRYTARLQDSQVHQRQILVQLDTARGSRTASALAKSTGLRHVSSMKLSYATYEIMQVPAGQDYMAALRALESNPGVKSVGPNVIKTVSEFVPNDPLFLNGASSTDEGLTEPSVKNNQWGLLHTGAQDAWDLSKGESDVVVAILDTGINFEAEDLVNRLWTNPGEIADNDIDDDDNGFVDDVHGYDFQTFDLSSGSGGDSDPTDTQGGVVSHGTATSSIVAGQGNNGLGIMGVAGGTTQATGVRIMVCRLGTDDNIPVAAEIAALDYARQNGAHIVSMSFGGASGGAPEEDAINRCWNNGNGVLVIAAAGNIGAGNEDEQGNPLIDLPAGFPNCLAVGATTIFSTQTVSGSTDIISETVAGYSKTGPELDIMAPGTHIMASSNSANEYTNSLGRQFTGTSAATPMVAGLAALMISAAPEGDNPTALELRTSLIKNVVDLGPTGRDDTYGHGRIQMLPSVLDFAGGKEGDTNGDNVVNEDDLDQIRARFGARTGDSNYDKKADANNDGVIDELDVFVVGRKFGS
ncbi:S8 family serine peptidase [bacterium]|nr:S8 family serine peptidase [bacterium]